MENFFECDIGKLRESELNPRQHYDPVKLDELAESIKGPGIIEPLVVRPAANGASAKGHFEIVAGSRRYRAAKIVGLEKVPVIKRELTDEQVLEIMVIENNQREDVNALEEARGYAELMKRKYSLDVLAAKIGRSKKYIYDRLKLLELIPEAQMLLLAGKMTPGHAILLARLKPGDQKRAIDVQDVDYAHSSGLFQMEVGELWAARDENPGKGPLAKYDGYKPVSVRELQTWIDDHIRFDKNAPVDAMVFPETAATVQDAKDMRLKIVQITHDHPASVKSDAKEGNAERIYGYGSWKLADGSGEEAMVCEKWVTGVVVVGPERGAAHKVCVNKECPVHWAKEKRKREKGAEMSSGAGLARENEERQRRDAEYRREEARRAAFTKAKPALISACAAKVKTAKFGELAQLTYHFNPQLRGKTQLGKPKTVEDLARGMLLHGLIYECNKWQRDSFSKAAKLIGVNVMAIVEAEMPKPVQTTGEGDEMRVDSIKTLKAGKQKTKAKAAKKAGRGKKKAA